MSRLWTLADLGTKLLSQFHTDDQTGASWPNRAGTLNLALTQSDSLNYPTQTTGSDGISRVWFSGYQRYTCTGTDTWPDIYQAHVSGAPDGGYDYRTLLWAADNQHPLLAGPSDSWEYYNYADRRFTGLSWAVGVLGIGRVRLPTSHVPQGSRDGSAWTSADSGDALSTYRIVNVGNCGGSVVQAWGGLRQFALTTDTLTQDELDRLDSYLAWDNGSQASLNPANPYFSAPPTVGTDAPSFTGSAAGSVTFAISSIGLKGAAGAVTAAAATSVLGVGFKVAHSTVAFPPVATANAVAGHKNAQAPATGPPVTASGTAAGRRAAHGSVTGTAATGLTGIGSGDTPGAASGNTASAGTAAGHKITAGAVSTSASTATTVTGHRAAAGAAAASAATGLTGVGLGHTPGSASGSLASTGAAFGLKIVVGSLSGSAATSTTVSGRKQALVAPTGAIVTATTIVGRHAGYVTAAGATTTTLTGAGHVPPTVLYGIPVTGVVSSPVNITGLLGPAQVTGVLR